MASVTGTSLSVTLGEFVKPVIGVASCRRTQAQRRNGSLLRATMKALINDCRQTGRTRIFQNRAFAPLASFAAQISFTRAVG